MEVIFYDFEYAQEKDVEGSLWQTHVVVNTEYRRAISHVNTLNQVVLKRKVDKLYRDFLKTSQFFYRAYIQRLSSQFDIPELRQVATDLKVDPFDVSQQQPAPLASLRSRLVSSCYLTLVRMGDLARYRCQNTEKPPKASLDIALTYYGLARMLNPDDGASYHQTAVLFQPTTNNFEIIYHFLRSVCVAKPHKLGATNLERAFKGLLGNQASSKGNSRQSAGKGPSDALTTWFLKLHAHYAQGVTFSAREELEKEVLHRLDVCLKAENNEQLALRILLANIAACDLAFENIKDSKDWTIERSKSCQYLLLFQVRVAVVLFRAFQPVLEDERNADISDNPKARNDPYNTAGMSASLKRFLPLIRIYVAWVYVSRENLNLYQEWLEPYIRDLYSLLADTLTLLLPYATSNPKVVDSKYLLPEDIEARGLKPFADRKLPLFLDVQIVPEYNPPKRRKTVKPRKENVNIDCRPEDEDIWRIRDILCCGIYLAGSAKSPLTIMTTTKNLDTWMYLKDGPLKSIDEMSMTRMFAQVKMAAHNKLIATADERVKRSVSDVAPLGQAALPRETTMQPPVQHRREPSVAAPQPIGPKPGQAEYAYSNLSLDEDMRADANMAGMVDKLLDGTDDDLYAQSNNTHGDTSYGMNSSVANVVFGNLMPSPVSRGPQPALTPSAMTPSAASRPIPNLPWNYFYSPTPAIDSGANQPAEDGFNVPRSVAAQTGTMSVGPGEKSPNAANYNNALNPFPMYGGQYGSRTEMAQTTSIPARGPSAAPALDSPTYSADQRAAALDNLKSALLAQYGTPAVGNSYSPTYAYGQPVYSDRTDGVRSKQGHRSKTSISSPLASMANSISMRQGKDSISQEFTNLQLGETQNGVVNEGRHNSIAARNGAQLQGQSPNTVSYGFPHLENQQAPSYNNFARSSAFGDSTFAQQFSSLSGNDTSLEFSSPSGVWASTPAAVGAPRGTVACNGNNFDATTAFGRNGSVNNREDPTHFRNRLEALGAGVGDSIAAYDRAVLEAAMAESDRKRSIHQ